MTFNYEAAEIGGLVPNGIHKIKIYDDAGNSTKWLSIDPDTYWIIRDALIRQGEKESDARKGLD